MVGRRLLCHAMVGLQGNRVKRERKKTDSK
jgi:hypothetical protein